MENMPGNRYWKKPLQLVFCLFNLENKIIVKTVVFIGELPRYKHTVGILNEYDIYQLFLIIRTTENSVEEIIRHLSIFRHWPWNNGAIL